MEIFTAPNRPVLHTPYDTLLKTFNNVFTTYSQIAHPNLIQRSHINTVFTTNSYGSEIDCTGATKISAVTSVHGNSVKSEINKQTTSTNEPTSKCSMFLPPTSQPNLTWKPYIPKTSDQYYHAQKSSREHSAAVGNYKNILYKYVDHLSDNADFVLAETDNCVVVYDAYPKATIHLLMLPKRHFLSDVRTCDDMLPRHLEQLKEMHSLAYAVTQSESVRAALKSRVKPSHLTSSSQGEHIVLALSFA